MAKIRLHIDPIGIEEKADEREWGRISRRVLKKDSIKEVTVAQLAQKLRTGHTVCPAILDGSKAADWQEQQVFMVDIDNADQGHPQLSQEQALRICDDYELSPVISYHNFRHLFARAFYSLEKDMAKLADLLGHASVETTRIYIMESGAEHKRQVERLGLVI